jgi:hypothetical protein
MKSLWWIATVGAWVFLTLSLSSSERYAPRDKPVA